jgi:hypothetical protein
VLLPVVRSAGTLYWASVVGVTGTITGLLSLTDLGLAAILVAIVAMPIYQLIGGVVALIASAASCSRTRAGGAARCACARVGDARSEALPTGELETPSGRIGRRCSGRCP